MHRAESAVAAEDRTPAVGTGLVGAEQRVVVLRAGEILRAVEKRRAVIELRHAIAAIERRPCELDRWRRRARRERATRRRGARIRGAIDAAVVADQRDLIAIAVVVRMERDR